MKRRLNTTLSLLLLAAKRIWNHRLLILCLLIGLITAVGTLSSIPLYADAAQNRILQGELTETGTYRPPFSFMWRYVGTWNGSLNQDAYQPVDSYLKEQAATIIGLPVEQTVRHVSSDKMRLFAGQGSGFNENEPLIWSSIAFITGMEAQVTLLEGTFPSSATQSTATEVAVSQSLAEQLGIQVGEQYTLLTDKQKQINVTVSGIWIATDPTAAFWIYPGAVVEVVLPDGHSIMRELHVDSSYLASESTRLRVGLGSFTEAATVRVWWQDNVWEETTISANQLITFP